MSDSEKRMLTSSIYTETRGRGRGRGRGSSGKGRGEGSKGGKGSNPGRGRRPPGSGRSRSQRARPPPPSSVNKEHPTPTSSHIATQVVPMDATDSSGVVNQDNSVENIVEPLVRLQVSHTNDELEKSPSPIPKVSPTLPYVKRRPTIAQGAAPPSFVPSPIRKTPSGGSIRSMDLATLKALTSLRALNMNLEDLGVSDAFQRRSAIAQLVGYDGYHEVTRERFTEWWVARQDASKRNSKSIDASQSVKVVASISTPVDKRHSFKGIRGTIRRSLSFKSNDVSVDPPSLSSDSTPYVASTEPDHPPERRRSSLFSSIPKLFSPVRKRSEASTMRPASPPLIDSDNSQVMDELHKMSSDLNEFTPDEVPSKPITQRGPTVGLDVLEALSDHWLDDDARGEAWLKNRQVEELREAVKDLDIRLGELREETDAWTGRSEITRSVCDDISHILSCLNLVIHKCDRVNQNDILGGNDISKECEQLLSETQSKIQKLVSLDDEIECWMDEGDMDKEDFVDYYQSVSFHEVYVEWVAQCSAAKRFLSESKMLDGVDAVETTRYGGDFSECMENLKILIHGIEEFHDGLSTVANRFEVIEGELSQDLETEETEQSRFRNELELLEGDEKDKGFSESNTTQVDATTVADSFKGGENGQIEEGVTVKRVVCRDTEDEAVEESTPTKTRYAISAANVTCSNGHKLRPYTSPRDALVCLGPCGCFIKTGAPFRGCKQCAFSQCLNCCDEARYSPGISRKKTSLETNLSSAGLDSEQSVPSSEISPGLDSLLELIGLPQLNTKSKTEESSSLGFSDTIATFFSPTAAKSTEHTEYPQENSTQPHTKGNNEMHADEERRPSGVASLEADVKEIADNIGGLFSSFGMSASGAVVGLFRNDENQTETSKPVEEKVKPAPIARTNSKTLHKSLSVGSGPTTRGRATVGTPRRGNTALPLSGTSVPSPRPQPHRSGSYRSPSPRTRLRQSTGSIAGSTGPIRASKRPISASSHLPSGPSISPQMPKSVKQRASVGSEPRRRTSGLGSLFNNSNFMKKSQPSMRRATSLHSMTTSKANKPTTHNGLSDRSKDVAELGGLLAKRGTLTPAETKRVQTLMRRNGKAKQSSSMKAAAASSVRGGSDTESSSDSEVEVDSSDVADISFLEKLAGDI